MKEFIWEFDEEEFNYDKQEPVIQYYFNGQKRIERWYLDGKLHREDGPAFKKWLENGQKKYEYWYIDGKRIKGR